MTTAPLAVASCRGARASFALAIEALAVVSADLQVNKPGEPGPLTNTAVQYRGPARPGVIPSAATTVAASKLFFFFFFRFRRIKL